ncbi:MAG: LamG domain-containing protein, partial [Armatimonadota bacterium]
MARPQMLYVGKQGALTYPAIGNVETDAGSKGTAAFWYHPSAEGQHCYVLQVTADSENWLVVRRDQADWVLQSYSSGASAMVISASDVVAWRHVVATWDFTTAGDGVLRLYLDGEEVPESPATGAPELQGPPDTIHVGPGSANQYTLAHAVFDELAIWNEVMTPEQVSALHEAGRMHIPQAEDGSGALLFRASWDEQYDAEVAEGDGTASFDGAADQYCRLDCGSRHRGKRFAYRLGTPKHDGSEDDRVPVMAVLQRTKYGTVESANTDEYGTLEVDASGNGHTVGAWLAPWLPGPEAPMTLRLGLHVPRDSAPEGPPIGVGAHDYFLGSGRRLTCASGCTTDTIYSPHLLEEDGYWAGGELSVLTGEADNEKQKVIGYSVADRSLTLGGQLSAAPAEGDVAIVAKPIRVEPVEGGSLYRLEADLSEEHDYIPRFAVLETAIAGERGYTCINHGRIQAFPGLIDRTDVFFGKREATVYDSWVLTVMIERVEMDGPGTYQRTEATDDTFLVVDPQTQESIKLWRQEGLVRETRQPEQYPTPSDIVADITEPGSWREALYHWPSWMEYDAVNEELLALVPGEDAAGEVRIGWVRGSWDEETGRVAWRDDPHPQNPMFTLDELQAATGGTSELFSTVGGVNGVFEVAEGEWALTFMATIGNPDGMVCCALTGAPDRYSFDPAKHFDRDLNPLKLPLAGDDRVLPDGSGIG